MLSPSDRERARSTVRAFLAGTLVVAVVAGVAWGIARDAGVEAPAIADGRAVDRLDAPVRLIYDYRSRVFNRLDAPFQAHAAEFVRSDDGAVTLRQVEPWRVEPEAGAAPICVLDSLPESDAAKACPAGSAVVVAPDDDEVGNLPHLLPFGLTVRAAVEAAPTVEGTDWEPFVRDLGLDVTEVVLVRETGEKRCSDWGMDCADDGPHPWEIDRVIHLPTGVELAEVESLGGYEQTRFQVREIEFPA